MSLSHEQQTTKRTITIIAVILILTLLLIYMQGGFVSKVSPGTSPHSNKTGSFQTTTVTMQVVGNTLSLPGVVKSKTVTDIAPRLTARILEIKVRAGDTVQKGDIIARLDQRDLIAQEKAALATLAGANAQTTRANADKQRISGLYAKEAATRENYDAVVALAKAAQAHASQATATLKEIRERLADTLLQAPFNGIVVKRLKQPGDMGMPGIPVVTLQTPNDLRLEVEVPATCASVFHLGETVTVKMDVINQVLNGTIDEIVPAMDTQTHSQLIKISLPVVGGLKPGYFGWLQQTCEEHTALLIPTRAVQYLGQLEIVTVLSDGRYTTRHIRTGKTFGNQVEVISGLRAGETLLTDFQQKSE